MIFNQDLHQGLMDKQEIKNVILEMGARARAAAHALTILSADKKNEILRSMAASMREQEGIILEANAKDIAAGEANGLNAAMLDRLRLSHERIEAIAAGIEEVAVLADPVGEVMTEWTRPNDIHFEQIRVPIGVIGIIYESRPNVTSDAAVDLRQFILIRRSPLRCSLAVRRRACLPMRFS